MFTQRAAKRIITEALESQMFSSFQRFDVTYRNFRLYGRVTDATTVGKVFMIQSIEIDPKFRNRGLFKALVREAEERTGLPVYVQCVGSPILKDYFTKSSQWQPVPGVEGDWYKP